MSELQCEWEKRHLHEEQGLERRGPDQGKHLSRARGWSHLDVLKGQRAGLWACPPSPRICSSTSCLYSTSLGKWRRKNIYILHVSELIGEMQIRTTMNYHFTLISMIVIKKPSTNKYRWECGERGSFRHCRRECQGTPQLWKTACSFLKKITTGPYEPTTSLLSIQRKGN